MKYFFTKRNNIVLIKYFQKRNIPNNFYFINLTHLEQHFDHSAQDDSHARLTCTCILLRN